MERPSKRARILLDSSDGSAPTPLTSLHRAISPPLPRGCPAPTDGKLTSGTEGTEGTEGTTRSAQFINSPIQLTHIRDLPDGNNVDTIRLRDILGDPMIRECWQFNYLFDVDFLMSQFDEDVRGLVQVKVVHGSWRREATNRIRVEVSLHWQDFF
jgi:tyrosyl-DNA phosphodiesterase-1